MPSGPERLATANLDFKACGPPGMPGGRLVSEVAICQLETTDFEGFWASGRRLPNTVPGGPGNAWGPSSPARMPEIAQMLHWL